MNLQVFQTGGSVSDSDLRCLPKVVKQPSHDAENVPEAADDDAAFRLPQ